MNKTRRNKRNAKKRKARAAAAFTDAQQDHQTELMDQLKRITGNASAADSDGLRSTVATILSGSNDYADTLHDVYLDYGYPLTLTFSNLWNMYRRSGVAKSVVELPIVAGWSTPPTITGASKEFEKDLDELVDRAKLWTRLKGLDTRNRVGRYAGLFMRVKDGNRPEEPVDKDLLGVKALVEFMPLYESQLQVVDVEQDATSERFGQPIMYQFLGSAIGTRNEDLAASFLIHPSRVVIAAEGSDNGFIYGVSALEAPYNSLMDLRKISGGGAEGFYKNAAQSIVFSLVDGASAKSNAAILDDFNDHADDFLRNRARRALWTPGMTADTLESHLIQPKEFFDAALADIAAGMTPTTPATIIIGRQTGVLASKEDKETYLSGVQSRRENFMTDLVKDVLDWLIDHSILPSSEYEIEWDDLLAVSDEERLENADKMSGINEKQFKSGGDVPFRGEEIREAAGFEPEELPDPGSEELDPVELEVIEGGASNE